MKINFLYLIAVALNFCLSVLTAIAKRAKLGRKLDYNMESLKFQ